MHDHNHDHTCDKHHGTTKENLRYGSRLQDGTAHTRDHQMWSRRDFLTQTGLGLAGASVMMNGSPVTAFGHAPLLEALSKDNVDRILVLIQLNGGNDALNMVVPYEIDEYYRVRPTIAIPKNQVINLENDHGLHPAMASLTNVWNDGNLAAMLNTGYDNSTRSHFAGTVNWATGSGSVLGQGTSTNFNSGIWGRYAKNVIDGMNGAPLTHPMAVRIGGPVSLFQSDIGNLGVSLGDSEFINQIAERGLFDAADTRLDPYEYGVPTKYVRSVANAALSYVNAIQDAATVGTNLAGTYPNGLGNNMAAAARLIRGGLNSRIISVSIGGFDTHSNQGSSEGRHANLMRSIADSVSAFLEDLAVDGLDEKVLLMTFSEFGRTLGENGSNGTDHGKGGSLMVFGKGIKRGVYGEQSDLINEIDRGGDPLAKMDHRTISATILEDWFGLPSEEVNSLMGADFPRLDFIENKIRVSNETYDVPETFDLRQNYPNPFNPSTTISFSLSHPGQVSLKVYDLNGRLIDTLVEGQQAAGPQAVTFDAGDLPSGTYVYRLTTPTGTQTKKMVLVK